MNKKAMSAEKVYLKQLIQKSKTLDKVYPKNLTKKK